MSDRIGSGRIGLRAFPLGPFDPKGLDDLPDILPVFPLSGALLLPGGDLPLNIFEPRYLAMIRYALATPFRLIGLIQPAEIGADRNLDPDFKPALKDLGCAGRITAFQETEDGRYRIELAGLIRFRPVAEMPGDRGFRLVRPDFSSYAGDLEEKPFRLLDRRAFLAALGRYLVAINAKIDEAALGPVADAALILHLAEAAPLSAAEKQDLLECETLPDLAQRLLAFFDFYGALAESGRQSLH